ncbi:MAG: 2-dehydropantoate 2-reductase [Acidobacteria bacterium]|nr:2-dehydropantoate 2-reductase [Acidobacteriota bacterium]
MTDPAHLAGPTGVGGDVVVLGTGAMACLFASRLATRRRVTLAGTWREQVEHLDRDGVEVLEPDGRSTRRRVSAVDDPRRAPGAALVLVQVKAPATERAALWARGILDRSPAKTPGLALSLQNGLGNLEILERVVGVGRAAQGVTEQAAHVVGPGVVRHAADGPTWLAMRPETADRLETVAELFEAVGLPTRRTGDARTLIWSKLVINCAINPLTALLGVPNGALVEEPRARRLMRRAAEEAATVARALGLELPFPDAGDRAEEVCRATAGNRSSMLQDLSRGATTEVDFISGAVVEHGRRVGVATPVNELLWQRLSATAPSGPVAAEDARELETLIERRDSEPCTS